MSRNKTYFVFFAPRRGTKEVKYQVLLSGVETDTYVTKHDIMKILTTEQYREFVKEIGIYEVPQRVLDPYLKKEPQTNERDRWKPR